MSEMSQDSDHQETGEVQLDTTTVIQAQQGDEDAFNRLYLRYFLSIGIFLYVSSGSSSWKTSAESSTEDT